jgi:hypothetical protein
MAKSRAISRPCSAAACYQAAKILAGAQLRVDRLVAALFAADGIRAAGIVGAGGAVSCYWSLAVTTADGVNRRKVQHVKAHVVDHRQAPMHVIEGAVARASSVIERGNSSYQLANSACGRSTSSGYTGLILR